LDTLRQEHDVEPMLADANIKQEAAPAEVTGAVGG
jgi:hypothetical protein